jgi:ankyrin repeat protein
MGTSKALRRALPANPSLVFLRKEAKRLAKAECLKLAHAQRRLAGEYGLKTWSALMAAVQAATPVLPVVVRPLVEAAGRADADAVRTLLAAGEPADANSDAETPLMRVCAGDAVDADKLAVAGLLLNAGASPRREDKTWKTALHRAARYGPVGLVELLIRSGGMTWQTDRKGRAALEHARAGKARDRATIIELLARPVIRDPLFRAAVKAIHGGDETALNKLLDTHPHLLTVRAIEPDCYPRDYFRDPRLFWFIANNPTLMKKVPDNIGAIAQSMIARGIAQEDLDYTIELVMSAGAALGDKLVELTAVLLDGGARVTPQGILVTLAHWVLEPVRLLLARGAPMTPAIAASFGHTADLIQLLRSATAEERQDAFGLAVINRQVKAARACLDAGADVNAPLPVHKHSRALHQAAVNNDVPMLELLVARGADTTARDTLWNGTPLGWAAHNGKGQAVAFLRSIIER